VIQDAGALMLATEAAIAQGDPKAADEHVRRLRASDPARVEGLRLAGPGASFLSASRAADATTPRPAGAPRST
jgi:hypothetical protein